MATPKVPTHILQHAKESGGLRLVELNAKQKSLKVQWVFRSVNNLFFNNIVSNSLIPMLGLFIWQCNLRTKDIQHLIKNSNFWTEVLAAWCEVNFYSPQTKKTS